MAFQGQDLTEYARIYGPKGNESYSGLTPIALMFPEKQTKEEREYMQGREAFQRDNLLGFTSRELAELDVISSRKLKDGNLRNGILPIMERDRWETRPPYPHWRRNHLYKVTNAPGYWSVDNPDVWRVLEPCLRLASRYVMSMHCLPWVRVLHPHLC